MKSLLLGVSAAAMMALALMPANASSFNMTIDTANQTDGYDISLKNVVTDGSGDVLSIGDVQITGLGTDSFLTGTGSLVTPTSTEGMTLEGSIFNFDGKAFADAPFFSPSGCCSGILLADGSDFLNPYLDPGSGNYFDSVSMGGAASNPGDLVNVSATPLPATIGLFAGGLGFIGFLSRRRKGKADADSRLPVLAAA